jgi:hypothetical protein
VIEMLAPDTPLPVSLSVICPLRENIVGGEGVVGVEASTTVSSPIGLRQHEAAALVSTIESVSMASPVFGLTTVRKSPNVFGSVSVRVKTVLPFLTPLMMYGIGVVLEYRSTDLK